MTIINTIMNALIIGGSFCLSILIFIGITGLTV